MTTRHDPLTGNVLSNGPGINLTPAQYDQAKTAHQFAIDLLPIIDSGKTWFTSYDIKHMPVWLENIVRVGVITKHKSTKHNGYYYRIVPGLTRAFCRTAIALRDERVKAMQERAWDGEASP